MVGIQFTFSGDLYEEFCSYGSCGSWDDRV